MKKTDYKNLSLEDLKEKVAELRKELFNLKFQNNLGQLTNKSLIKKVRKDIARVNTLLTLTKNN